MNSLEQNSFQITGPSKYSCLSKYQGHSDYERLSNTKSKQREKILDFLLSNNPCDHIKYVGLPGKYWAIERELLNIDADAKFSGFEKNPVIFYKALQIMPGGHKTISKSKIIDDRIKLEIYVNKNGVYTLGDINHFTEKKTHALLISESGSFRFGFTLNNMLWYDFTSSFNENTFRAIHDIKKITRHKTAICLTLQYGRDLYFNGKGEEARVDIVKKALKGFECKDVWTYNGFKDTKMINICGIRTK